MIGDLAELADGQALECDVCIAGSGAAGLTLALALAKTPLRVVVLEGGGREYEPESQELYRGRNIGREYFELDAARLRYLGGTTNHWGGMCGQLEPLDFEVRPWVPYSGWPIRHADLVPYYERAAPIIGSGSARHDAPSEPKGGPLKMPPFDPDRIHTSLYRVSLPRYLPHRKYARELETWANLRLFLHAGLVRVQLAADAGSVTAFRVRGRDGRAVEVRAKAYVLALGGIENPRLLLASNDIAMTGVGNGRDLVGRFFLEHAEVPLGTCAPSGNWYRSFLTHEDKGGRFWLAIVNAPGQQEREQVLNCGIQLNTLDTPSTRSPGFIALGRLRRELFKGKLDAFGGDVWRVLTDLGGVLEGYRDSSHLPLEIFGQVELAPNPDCRVALDNEVDALGLPRVTLDWRLGELDKRTMRTAVLTLAAELGRLRLGRVQVPEWLTSDDASFGPDLVGGYHHMGTTRMSESPATGVVDRDCRVHGVANLYVAGSSVFPTGGHANPTLNIVALTLRLADHLLGIVA